MFKSSTLLDKTAIKEQYNQAVANKRLASFRVEVLKVLHSLESDYYNKWVNTILESGVKEQINRARGLLEKIDKQLAA